MVCVDLGKVVEYEPNRKALAARFPVRVSDGTVSLSLAPNEGCPEY